MDGYLGWNLNWWDKIDIGPEIEEREQVEIEKLNGT